ncbi:hypothetical protein C0989_004599 [Termitomyces sp. Mn162]|nr:hypothetical protein C0989_004599 [Termitomyces sp. Mn162]
MPFWRPVVLSAFPKLPKLCPNLVFPRRLYFTTFIHPAPHPHTLNLAGESATPPRVRTRPRGGPSASPDDMASYYYFTIDDQLLYLSFFQDWGPLNLAMVYKACILIHELLEDKELASHRLVLYSSNDPRRKANAALLMALYVMIVQRRAPWEAFHPIAEMEFMPFRDAGRGPSDFNLSIQDCLWGVWKAMQNGLLDMNEFSVEDYEFYEKVENGDWNWLTPHFIALASPVDPNWLKQQKDNPKVSGSRTTTGNASLSSSISSNLALQRKLPQPFINCLEYFDKSNVKLVIRLNTELYDRSTFLDRGIDHMELYFDDGTNPTDEIVRTFIDVSERVIESGGVVAVHCKAGLGRTGTLIGAYLIWKYGFTASEVIALMRIIRPGSVVGPQQQYMYLKQLEWVKWGAIDETRKIPVATVAAPNPVVTPATPPAEADEEVAMRTTLSPPTLHPVTPSRHVATAAAKAGEIAPPGQPRKTPASKRLAQDSDDEGSDDVLPTLGAVPVRTRVKPSKSSSSRGVTASEQRPSRVTRSTASAAQIRKTGNAATITASPVKPPAQGPNKIPRLATTKTTSASKALQAASAANAKATPRPVSTHRPNRPNRPPSPVPSRLPTLIPSKRPLTHMTSVSEVTGAADKKDAWMKANASAVVTPATTSGRPGLRSVRRRRSSFSSADVVA